MARLLCLVTLLVAILAAVGANAENLRSESALEVFDVSKPAPQPKPKACWKEGDARGSGVLPDKSTKTCPVSHPEKSMGLCYAKCKNDKREGLGPLCWDSCSKMVYKANGLIFCCQDDDTCSQLVSDLAIKLPQALVKFFIDISVNPANVLKILRDFRALVADALELTLPLCEDVKSGAFLGEGETNENVKTTSEEIVIADI